MELSVQFSKKRSSGSTHPAEGNQCQTLISSWQTSTEWAENTNSSRCFLQQPPRQQGNVTQQRGQLPLSNHSQCNSSLGCSCPSAYSFAAAATLSQVAVPAAPLQAVKSPSGKLREAHMLWAISQMAEVPLNSRWLLYGNCQVTSRCLHKALPSLQGAQKSEFSHVLQTKLDTAIKCPFNPPSRKEGLHCTQFFQSQPQHLASSIQTWN